MWSLIIAAGFIVAQPSIGLSQNGKENTEARKLFNKGVEFHINKDYVEAEKRFREALWLYPNADQSDRTAFYLIDTLVKLRRVQEARAEAENFRKRHPQSKWDADVNEVILKMGGQL
jgi:TolA-binding protein